MDALLPIIPFVIAIAALIIVHELGHFLAAKISRIKVEEFGIGFPPRLARLFKWGETQFTLNWIPLGGFVRPAGETDTSVGGGFSAANPWARLFVYVSGPLMNLLTALLIYTFIFLQLGKPDISRVEIMDVSTNSPAFSAGLEAGDIVLSVNGEPVDSSEELRSLIYANLGQAIEVSYLRNGETFTGSLTPRDPAPADGAIGISMGHPLIPINPLESVVAGGQAIYEQSSALIALPGRMIRGEVSADEGRLVGYKGMYDIYTEVREADSSPDSNRPAGINTLSFFASISVSLGLLNLLPVPALDGGRILFTLPEILFKRRIPQSYENFVNAVGLALLLLLIVYINLQDFLNPVVLP
jgi:regulator of sigma E protease